jgi:hypothetical protein
MPQISSRSNPVAHELLELLDIRESTLILARPDDFVVNADLEDASGAGYKRNFADLILKCRQKFLCHPGSAQQPSALGAVLDLNSWGSGRHF